METIPPGALAVLHVSQPTEAGVARIVADLATRQVERGWRVGVACPAHADLPQWARASGAGYLEWPARNAPGPGLPREMRRLRSCVDAFEPEIVHLHSSKAGLAGRLVLRGRTPTIFEPNAWSFEALRALGAAAARAWERRGARWTDAIVCVSEAERRLGTRAGIDAKWRVVPNGVDLEKLPVAGPEDRARARASLGLPDDPTVICVGRLSIQKGQDLLLDGWPRVLRAVPAARLYLVGDGPERSALQSRGLERVRFAGRRDDVPTWLAAADVVAMPSRWEGCSLAMLEAMATGRSLVATNVSGASEAIREDAGAVVALGDVDALAMEIASRLADPRRVDGEGRVGRRRVEDRHDLRVTESAIAGLYAEVLAARGR